MRAASNMAMNRRLHLSRLTVRVIAVTCCLLLCSVLYFAALSVFSNTQRNSSYFGFESTLSRKIYEGLLTRADDVGDMEPSERAERNSPLPFQVDSDSSPCSCEDGADTYGPLDEPSDGRRLREAEEWTRHHQAETEPPSLCRALSPIQYIGSGITVEPLRSVRLIGLAVHPEVVRQFPEGSTFVIGLRSMKSLGVLYLRPTALTKDLTTTGNDTKSLQIRGKLTSALLGEVLANLFYNSTVYDINDRDAVKFDFNNFIFPIHIHIRRTTVPFLFDPGDGGDIKQKVTVITKTFERYTCVNNLVASVNKYYPGMTIVVADDSENPRKINATNVKQYIMPFAEGASAGRNLALSQVRTKYFLYVDDDFVFTERTTLERFVEKFEDPRLKLDVIGGTFENGEGESRGECFGCRTVHWRTGGDDTGGDCFVRHSGDHYHQLPEYPQCYMTDSITMFFMARTEAFRRGVFDPEYERVGHTEYFINRLGKIRVASCSDVSILHVPLRNAKYLKYRENPDTNAMVKHNLFNMNLKCFTL